MACSFCVNDVNSGSPSRIRIVLRISFGITTRPKSSMRRTIPVAFIVFKTFQLWVVFALEVLSAEGWRLCWKNEGAVIGRRRIDDLDGLHSVFVLRLWLVMTLNAMRRGRAKNNECKKDLVQRISRRTRFFLTHPVVSSRRIWRRISSWFEMWPMPYSYSIILILLPPPMTMLF